MVHDKLRLDDGKDQSNDIHNSDEEHEMQQESYLSGKSASDCMGTVGGVARVGTSGLQADEILVIEEADANHSAVFPIIKALVVERGGVLCHAAITAREYNLPCILGVQAATKQIQTGDRIRLESRTGKVKCLG